MHKNGQVDSLWASTLPKVRITPKNTLSKSCWTLDSIQKSLGYIRLSPAEVELGAFKDCHLLKYYNIQKWERIVSLWGSTLPEIRIIPKNASNKSCWALNSVQKSYWAHTSISRRSGAGPPKIVIFWNIIMFKNGKVQFYFEARCCQKYTLYPKMLQIIVVKHWIAYKKVSGCICLSPPGEEQ